VLTSAEKQRLVGRLTAGADLQSNAWGSIAGLLTMGSYSVGGQRRSDQHVPSFAIFALTSQSLHSKSLTVKAAKDFAKNEERSIDHFPECSWQRYKPALIQVRGVLRCGGTAGATFLFKFRLPPSTCPGSAATSPFLPGSVEAANPGGAAAFDHSGQAETHLINSIAILEQAGNRKHGFLVATIASVSHIKPAATA
jgi:hypothetical protein